MELVYWLPVSGRTPNFEVFMRVMNVTAIIAAILAPIMANAEDLAPMALNSLPAPPPKITSAPVENLHGQVIGRVEKVVTDPSGKPVSVSVITPEGTKVIGAAAASYDEARNLVFTDQQVQQLANSAR